MWDAWRGLIEREDARWRKQAGEASGTEAAVSSDVCSGPAKPPTLADLVRERANELKRD